MRRPSLLSLVLVAGPTLAQQTVRFSEPPRWDDSFGLPGLDSSAAALALFDDGAGEELYIGGSFDAAGTGMADDLVRWTGTSWQPVPLPAYTLSGNRGIYGLCAFDDGSGSRLFANGRYEIGAEVVGVLAWDGSSWETFAIEGSFGNPVYSLFSDGTSLYAGGRFNRIGGVSVQHVARYDADGWHPMAVGPGAIVWIVRALATSDAQGATRLYAGMEAFAGRETLYWWDGSSWVAVPGLTASVTALAHHAGPNGPELLVVAGGALLSLTGAGFAPFAPGAPTGVVTLLSRQEKGVPILYAGGGFSTAGGRTVNNVTRWNGTRWQALGAVPPGVEGQYVADLAFADLGQGEQLFAAGAFGAAGGKLAMNVASWGGESWSALGGGEPVFNAAGYDDFDFAVFDDGDGPRVYIAGTFSAGSARIPDLARWEGDHWAPVPGSPFSVSDHIEALHVWDDGTGPALYVGGSFKVFGSRSIARWDGGTWSGLSSGLSGFVGGPPTVLAIEDFDDGGGSELWVGGGFTDAGGVSVENLARWDGSSWFTAGDPNETVNDLEAWDDGTSQKLYVAGSFTEVGGVSVSNIASWDGTTWSDLDGGIIGGSVELQAIDLPALGGRQLMVFGDTAQAGGTNVSGGLARWNGTSWGSDLGLSASRTDGVACWNDGTGAKLFVAARPFVSNAGQLWVLDRSGWRKVGGTGPIFRSMLAYERGPLGPSLWVAADSSLFQGSIGVARLHRSGGSLNFTEPLGTPPGAAASLLGSHDPESDDVVLRITAAGPAHWGALVLGTELGPSWSSGLPRLSVGGIVSVQPVGLSPAGQAEIRLRLPGEVATARIYAQAVLLADGHPTFSDVLSVEVAGPAREE